LLGDALVKRIDGRRRKELRIRVGRLNRAMGAEAIVRKLEAVTGCFGCGERVAPEDPGIVTMFSEEMEIDELGIRSVRRSADGCEPRNGGQRTDEGLDRGVVRTKRVV